MDIDELAKKLMMQSNKQEYNQYGIPYDRHEVEMAEAKLIGPVSAATESREIEKMVQRDIEYQAKKDKALFKASENSEKQVELLKEQLEKVNEQNELLQESCSELKKANEQLKEDAATHQQEREEDNKAAKKTRGLSIAALVLSVVLSVAAILTSVLLSYCPPKREQIPELPAESEPDTIPDTEPDTETETVSIDTLLIPNK